MPTRWACKTCKQSWSRTCKLRLEAGQEYRVMFGAGCQHSFQSNTLKSRHGRIGLDSICLPRVTLKQTAKKYLQMLNILCHSEPGHVECKQNNKALYGKLALWEHGDSVGKPPASARCAPNLKCHIRRVVYAFTSPRDAEKHGECSSRTSEQTLRV